MALLRPPGPRVGDIRLAARYVSATDSAMIGGDLYGVLDTPFGVRAIIGDVRGKGLTAVRAASVVLGAFREAAYDEPDLVGVARRLEASVVRHVPSGEFTTALLVGFHQPGSVDLLHCGHVAPLLVAPDGTRGRARPARPLGAARPGPPGRGGRRPAGGCRSRPGTSAALHRRRGGGAPPDREPVLPAGRTGARAGRGQRRPTRRRPSPGSTPTCCGTPAGRCATTRCWLLLARELPPEPVDSPERPAPDVRARRAGLTLGPLASEEERHMFQLIWIVIVGAVLGVLAKMLLPGKQGHPVLADHHLRHARGAAGQLGGHPDRRQPHRRHRLDPPSAAAHRRPGGGRRPGPRSTRRSATRPDPPRLARCQQAGPLIAPTTQPCPVAVLRGAWLGRDAAAHPRLAGRRGACWPRRPGARGPARPSARCCSWAPRCTSPAPAGSTPSPRCGGTCAPAPDGTWPCRCCWSPGPHCSPGWWPERPFALVLLAFFGWQFFHFQKQNLGLSALAAGAYGLRPRCAPVSGSRHRRRGGRHGRAAQPPRPAAAQRHPAAGAAVPARRRGLRGGGRLRGGPTAGPPARVAHRRRSAGCT